MKYTKPAVSVLTLVRGRPAHLLNVVRGLRMAEFLPDELIIAYMNQPEHPLLPDLPFPVYTLDVSSAKTLIPLAAARNAAAAAARGDILLFLDVDCIPHPAMISQMLSHLRESKGLLMGTIRYLLPGATADPWTWADLDARSVAHPARPHPQAGQWMACSRYELFWTLCFAMDHRQFDSLGGFDERYYGYGAEDTDFAFRARQQKIPFALSAAACYHQHHPVSRPPLPHLTDIVRNAQHFRDVWGIWPMESWLAAFAERGLIKWNPDASAIHLLRLPTEAELMAAREDTPAGF